MAVLCHRSCTGWMPARCHQQLTLLSPLSIKGMERKMHWGVWCDGEGDNCGDGRGHRWAPASEVESNKNRLARFINMVHSGLQRQPRVQLTFLFTVRGRGGCWGEGVASTKMTIILKNGEPQKTVHPCRTTLSHSAKTLCYAWCSSAAKSVAAAFVSALFILICGLESIVRPFHDPMATGMLILYLYCSLKGATWCEHWWHLGWVYVKLPWFHGLGSF